MKKFLLILIIAVSFGMVSQANALMIGDALYVGSINNGIPSSEAAEAGYINYLITLAAGATDTQLPPGTGEIYNREGSTLAGPFPAATDTGAIKQDNSNTTYSASGFEYVLGKYDASKAGSLVWFMEGGFGGDVILPSTYNGHGLSHTTAFNYTDPGTTPGGDPVPEPGTLLLVGIGLAGLAGFSRKKFKKNNL